MSVNPRRTVSTAPASTGPQVVDGQQASAGQARGRTLGARRPRHKPAPPAGSLLPSRDRLPGGVGERPEEAVVVAGLRVPLHAETEPGTGDLDRLKHPVLGPRRRREAVGHPAQRLVVVTLGRRGSGPSSPCSRLPGAVLTSRRANTPSPALSS